MKKPFQQRAGRVGSYEGSMLRAVSEDADLLDRAVLGGDIDPDVIYYAGCYRLSRRDVHAAIALAILRGN